MMNHHNSPSNLSTYAVWSTLGILLSACGLLYVCRTASVAHASGTTNQGAPPHATPLTDSLHISGIVNGLRAEAGRDGRIMCQPLGGAQYVITDWIQLDNQGRATFDLQVSREDSYTLSIDCDDMAPFDPPQVFVSGTVEGPIHIEFSRREQALEYRHVFEAIDARDGTSLQGYRLAYRSRSDRLVEPIETTLLVPVDFLLDLEVSCPGYLPVSMNQFQYVSPSKGGNAILHRIPLPRGVVLSKRFFVADTHEGIAGITLKYADKIVAISSTSGVLGAFIEDLAGNATVEFPQYPLKTLGRIVERPLELSMDELRQLPEDIAVVNAR